MPETIGQDGILISATILKLLWSVARLFKGNNFVDLENVFSFPLEDVKM